MTSVLVALVAALAAAPPPATATASGRTVRLALGSYCWTTQCVDYIPPPRRTDLPRLQVPRGTKVVLRLRFTPTSWSAGLWGSRARTTFRRARTATWTVRRAGILELSVRGYGGSASYLLKLALP